MRADPSERIIFERAPQPNPPPPLWVQITLGVVLGGIVLFSLWFGYQKYQEYRFVRSLEAATNVLHGSMERMNEQSRQAAIERRRTLEAQNQARQQRLEESRLRMEQEHIAREAQLEAGRDRAEYMQKLSDPKCQFWMDNLRTTGSDKAKAMVGYYCPN
ncbi:hypothetical protein CLV44_11893 [Marinobacterium halophilum]|uniref:Uncharacterized protein n=1 Tax=Marinobacterium halophilum TaxID=267374 RepID=A0A2P8ESK0_9GAMM|nr:hypothetical protein [Marinobacterium halophilum]PSL12415.1 hypothetical protein CLV44_11893 [Marinobacterium halophilum]